MARGNKPMRVSSEFYSVVERMRRKFDKTSAEITKEIARSMKKVK